MTEPYIFVVPVKIMEAVEIQLEIDEIYEKFPLLAEYDPDSYCCEACGYTDVAEDLGDEAVKAWERLNDLHFMLAGLFGGEAVELEFDHVGHLTEDVLGDCDE